MVSTLIQISSDQSLLSGSPGLIAASHVLHRFRLPRCPPFALTALTRHTLYSLVKDRISDRFIAAQSCITTDHSATPRTFQGSFWGRQWWKLYPTNPGLSRGFRRVSPAVLSTNSTALLFVLSAFGATHGWVDNDLVDRRVEPLQCFIEQLAVVLSQARDGFPPEPVKG